MFVQPGPEPNVASGQVHWIGPSGAVRTAMVDWWRPTVARPDEGRLGRIHQIESWHINEADYGRDVGQGHKWFWRLCLDDQGRLWADIVKQGTEIDTPTQAIIDDISVRIKKGPLAGVRDVGADGPVADVTISAFEVAALDEATEDSVPSPADLARIDSLTRGKNIEVLVARYAERSRGKSPEEIKRHVTRLKRNYALVQALKKKFGYTCQLEICRFTFKTRSGANYCEAAHVRPLHGREADLDTPENILILCPNHHKMLDYGAMVVVSPTEVEIDGKKSRLYNPS